MDNHPLLSLDAIIGTLTHNKVFQQVNVDPCYEQGSSSAKNAITLPGQCMPPSLLDVRRHSTPKKGAASTGPIPEQPVVVDAAPAPVPDPVAIATQATKWTLKELKKEKVAVIHEIAQAMGISLVNKDTKRKKIKEELMNEIVEH